MTTLSSNTNATTTKASILEQLQHELRSASTPLRNATVSLGREGRGSGVVIADGVVATNAHVLRDKTITVRFSDGRVAQGSVRGIDADGDLAVLDVDTTGASPLGWADSDAEVGTIVLGGHGNGTVSMGIVSGTGRSFRGPRGRLVNDSFEHTAPLARGASGGPVVNLAGQILGINTARNDAGYRAVAVTADFRARVERLVGGRNVERRVIGIAVVPTAAARKVRQAAGLPERNGVLIQSVAPDSAASAGGLAQGDLIVEAAGTPIANIDDLNAALDQSGRTADSSTIELLVVRGAEERTAVLRWPAE